MRTATIFYSDGQRIRTSINGTNSEIQNYFKIGRYFNIGGKKDNQGNPIDNMQRVEALTIEN